ncbi:hypothetical protein PRZ48_001295 [Zasmidium cellare]|uniref:RRM domain-containing protein n=1 Tax=Zasmidium cellare TaxID=395010 RepID=A0ABR0F1J8_ZASCE|nr:hypothetical protein PRZ48_001295 [Zasmidium cellare]
MQSVRQIERLNQIELDKCVPPNASWHTDYRDTAYIYIGGLPFELSEGDILTIFSQYGNPVHINLVRDKDTGKSRGFCFLKYEDQRSCDLAVDNLSGAGVMGRVLSVDHTRYKKKEGEVEVIGDEQQEAEADDDTDREGDERRKRRKTESESEEEERPMIKEEIELAKLLREHDEDDPMKAYLVKEKREEVAEALKKVVKHEPKGKGKDREHRHRHHHRSRRDGEDRDRKEDRHRSRRERDEDDEPRHKSHRSRRDDRDEDRHRSRRERSRTPESEDDRDRRKPKSRRDERSPDEERRDRRDREERSRKRDDRSVSREPYRRR